MAIGGHNYRQPGRVEVLSQVPDQACKVFLVKLGPRGFAVRDPLEPDKARELETRHLQRLSIVSGLGLLLAAAPLLVTVRLGFGVALLLGALAVLGLGLPIGFLKRQSD